MSAHIEYVQENIVELQNDLIALDDSKSDGDTVEAHAIITTSSPRESKYLLEHLLDMVLDQVTLMFGTHITVWPEIFEGSNFRGFVADWQTTKNKSVKWKALTRILNNETLIHNNWIAKSLQMAPPRKLDPSKFPSIRYIPSSTELSC